jgi:precorrin-4 C11-methyltransferase
MTRNVVLIAVTERGIEHARRLRGRLRAGRLVRPERYGPCVERWERSFSGSLADGLPALFEQAEQLVFFLSAGAVIRLVAPLLSSKHRDPGVIVVDEAAEFVVPLLSGHEGGANAFARTVAGCLGATPVITTASEAGESFNLLGWAESWGWVAEPAERIKPTAMALVNRETVGVVQEIGHRGCWLNENRLGEHIRVVPCVEQLAADVARTVWITDRVVHERAADERVLWLRPKSLVLGVGCERGITAEALEDGLRTMLAASGWSLDSIAALASLDLKSDEAGLVELAERHGWATIFYTADELARVPGIARPSSAVQACVGTPGVAEPAALLAAGATTLLVEKQVVSSSLASQKMTFALARSARFEERRAELGHVALIGAGPGDPDLLTLKAARLIEQADVVIYAGSLIPDQVVDLAPPHAVRHNSATLTLEEVSALTIAAARSGQRVVRLQSGDTSIYSTIQEQMTLLDEAGIPFDVVAGVSAFQAAAAALKTELTLPEAVQTVILTRGEGQTSMPEGESLASLAAHRATLCIFLSATLADRVQAQLLTAYSPGTPVAILYRVSWPDENIVITTLAHLAEQVRAAGFTRTTLILVGEAIGGRKNRSRLYDNQHGHLFRAAKRAAASPSA